MKNDFLNELFDYAGKIREPDNLFSGKRNPPGFELPDNILIFFHDFTEALPNAHGRHTLVIPFNPMTYYIERRKIELSPGTLLYVPPFAVRFLHPSSSGYSRFFITFELKRTQKYLPLPGVSRFTKQTERALKHFLRQYDSGSPESASVALMEFLQIQKKIVPEKISENVMPDAVAQTIEWVESHLTDITGIKDLSEKINISESHLRSLFRKYTGISLGKFIADKKMDYAKHHLTYSDLRISEIAAGCGFSNVFVFSAFFKRNTGFSPLQFRKKAQSGKNEDKLNLRSE